MKRKYTATSLITLAFLVGGAQAGTYTVVGGQVKNDSIAIGKSSEASSPKDANVSSVAVGKSANATGEGSIAIGDSAAVKLDTTKPKENLDGSIAIGRLAIVKTTRGTAIGSSALVEGHESSAFGSSAQATEQLSLAIGSYAKSFVDHGVALGASSEVKRSGGVAGYDFQLALARAIHRQFGNQPTVQFPSERAQEKMKKPARLSTLQPVLKTQML